MYNTQQISDFITRVNTEAQAAAQAVYDKYNDELIERVKNQLGKGSRFLIGMGTAVIKNKHGDEIADDFATVLSQTQYWQENISAGFDLPDISK